MLYVRAKVHDEFCKHYYQSSLKKNLSNTPLRYKSDAESNSMRKLLVNFTIECENKIMKKYILLFLPNEFYLMAEQKGDDIINF